MILQVVQVPGIPVTNKQEKIKIVHIYIYIVYLYTCTPLKYSNVILCFYMNVYDVCCVLRVHSTSTFCLSIALSSNGASCHWFVILQKLLHLYLYFYFHHRSSMTHWHSVHMYYYLDTHMACIQLYHTLTITSKILVAHFIDCHRPGHHQCVQLENQGCMWDPLQ